MTDPSREDAALDALIASSFIVSTGDDLTPLDDPAIPGDELLAGRTAIDARPPPITKWTAEALEELEGPYGRRED